MKVEIWKRSQFIKCGVAKALCSSKRNDNNPPPMTFFTKKSIHKSSEAHAISGLAHFYIHFRKSNRNLAINYGNYNNPELF